MSGFAIGASSGGTSAVTLTASVGNGIFASGSICDVIYQVHGVPG